MEKSGLDRLAEISRVISGFVLDFVRQNERDLYAGRPSPHSEARIESTTPVMDPLGQPWPSREVERASETANLYQFAVEDHLLSMAELIPSRQSVLGYALMARAAIESAGKLWWLLDPSIDVKGRVSRSYALSFDSGSNHGSMAMGFGQETPDEPLQELIGHARSLGLRIVEKKAKVTVVGEGVPKHVELVHAVMTAGGIPYARGFYSYLSGRAHGTKFSLTDYVSTGDGVPDGFSQVSKIVDEIEVVAHWTVRTTGVALERAWQYKGWDVTSMRRMREFIEDKLVPATLRAELDAVVDAVIRRGV